MDDWNMPTNAELEAEAYLDNKSSSIERIVSRLIDYIGEEIYEQIEKDKFLGWCISDLERKDIDPENYVMGLWKDVKEELTKRIDEI